MKKILVVFICLIALSFSLCACSNDVGNNGDADNNGNLSTDGGADTNDDATKPDDTNKPDDTDNTPVFDSSSIVGTWQLYSVDFEGKAYALGEELNGEILHANMMVMEFKEDGKGTYSLMVGGNQSPEVFPITWKTESESWIAHINGIDSETTIVDGKLFMNDVYSKMVYIFTKQINNGGVDSGDKIEEENDALNGEYGLNPIVVENISSGVKATYNVGETYNGMLLTSDTISVVLNNGSGTMSYSFERSVTTNITYEVIDDKFIMICEDAVDLFNDGNPQNRYELLMEEIDGKMCFVLTASNIYSIFSYYVIAQ